MIEPEPFIVEITVDTSKFTTALEQAQFTVLLWCALSPEDRIRMAALGRMADIYQDFERSMDEIRRITGMDL